MPKQRILIYGPGVIGTFYASRLCAHNDVTLLARGRRLNDLREKGLQLINEDIGAAEKCIVNVIDTLKPDDRYDFIFVTMRCQQALEILPVLRANCSPNVVFMMNGVTSYDAWHSALGVRLVTAFPVLGGEVRDGTVYYATGLDKNGRLQKTYIGAPGGNTPGLMGLAEMMAQSGLPVQVVRRMRDYHFMHVALVSPIANALYKCNGSNYELAANPTVLREMLIAMREGFRAMKAKGIRMTPASLNAFNLIPLCLAVPYAARLFNTKHIETVAARHARNARDEMGWLYKELMEYTADSGVEMTVSKELGKYI